MDFHDKKRKQKKTVAKLNFGELERARSSETLGTIFQNYTDYMFYVCYVNDFAGTKSSDINK